MLRSFVFCLLFLTLWPTLGWAQLTMRPKVERCSHKNGALTINHVALTPESTLVEITFTNKDTLISTICAAKGFLIKGSTQSSAKALRIKGVKKIPYCPDRINVFPNTSHTFSLVFPRLAPGIEVIDVLEVLGAGELGSPFNFYKVHIRNPGVAPEEAEEVTAEAEVAPPPAKGPVFAGKKVKLNDEIRLKIQFPHASYQITSASEPEIKKVAEMLKKFPKLFVRLEGHTEADQPDYSPRQRALNVKLSTQRVLEVRNRLLQLGVRSNQVKWKGFGGVQPASKTDQAKNRRIVMRVLSLTGEE